MADNIIYRNYGETDFHEIIGDFVKSRIQLEIGSNGGFRDGALEQTWAVSVDGGETFRNPTIEERQEVHEAIWDYRSQNVNCARECGCRARIDGMWRCVTANCGAVWNDPDAGRTYGVPMTALQLRQAVWELAQNDDVKTSWRARMEKALRVIGDYEIALLTGQMNILIMDVKLTEDACVSFLALKSDRQAMRSLLWAQQVTFSPVTT